MDNINTDEFEINEENSDSEAGRRGGERPTNDDENMYNQIDKELEDEKQALKKSKPKPPEREEPEQQEDKTNGD